MVFSKFSLISFICNGITHFNSWEEEHLTSKVIQQTHENQFSVHPRTSNEWVTTSSVPWGQRGKLSSVFRRVTGSSPEKHFTQSQTFPAITRGTESRTFPTWQLTWGGRGIPFQDRGKSVLVTSRQSCYASSSKPIASSLPRNLHYLSTHCYPSHRSRRGASGLQSFYELGGSSACFCWFIGVNLVCWNWTQLKGTWVLCRWNSVSRHLVTMQSCGLVWFGFNSMSPVVEAWLEIAAGLIDTTDDLLSLRLLLDIVADFKNFLWIFYSFSLFFYYFFFVCPGSYGMEPCDEG